MKKISIIAPVFEKVTKIDEILQKVSGFFAEKYDFEILAYCDKVFPQDIEDYRLTVINTNGNRDFNQCVIDGFERAAGDCIIIADINNKNLLDYLTKMLVEWEAKAQVVLIKKSKKPNIFARLWQKFTNLLLSFAGLHSNFYAYNNFQLFSREVAEVIKSFPEKNYYLRNFECWVDYRVSILYGNEKLKVKNKTKNFTKDSALSLTSFLMLAGIVCLVVFGSPYVQAPVRATFVLLGVGMAICLGLFSLFCFYRWFVYKKTLLEIKMK